MATSKSGGGDLTVQVLQALDKSAPLHSAEAFPEVTFAEIKAALDKSHASLSPREILWRDRQPLLQARGYMLRPRYHPKWVASWEANPSLNSDFCEDHIQHPVC